ncbi:SDR family NAD(P)-dependent oxidoreductase [Campylobacter hepaticus]|nr:SDR family NAD(P)-dependent oxidoreductase [Campylobacter hepaticus]
MKKVAIITGSASGIGLNMAEKFLEQNYNVVFSDINEDALNLAMKNYPQEKILGIKCDVSKESDMQNLIHKAYEKFKRIDVLINNAGLQYVAKIEDFPVDKFKQMIEIMLVGAFCSTKYVLPIMKEQQCSPQIQNLIPIKYFDTTAMAAPIMGIICGLIMFVGGYFYLKYRENYLKNLGEFYEESKDKYQLPSDEKIPHFILSLIPLLCVIILLNVFSFEIINALLCGIFAILLLNIHRFRNFVKAMNEGVQGSIIAIINTSAAVGFGSVVKAVPGFQTLTNLLLDFKINPLISEGIAVNLLAGTTGSASGGMGIALEALGAKYKEIALSENIPLELFHRVASIASGGLDALPHNGAVLTLLAITSMSHKKSYLDICVVAVIIPIIALIVGIILAYFGIY